MNMHVDEQSKEPERLEYPEHFTKFIPIYETLHRLEKVIPSRDIQSIDRLKELRTNLAQLQSNILKGWYAQKQAEEKRRREEAERMGAERMERLKDKPRASRASKSPTGKTVAHWAHATPEERDMLSRILRDVHPLRERVRETYGTPEYGYALDELHREVNRRCFEEELPPYIGEHGKHPGYGDEGMLEPVDGTKD